MGKRPLGVSSSKYEESGADAQSHIIMGKSVPAKTVSVAVVGAHLRGFPLNKDLTSRGATFAEATKTAPRYRLFSLAASEGTIRKPGLQRVGKDCVGASIEVGVWNLPESQFASFFGTIPSPLGLGSVELETGSWVFGFICEPFGLDGAADISHHGGWRNYMAAEFGDSLAIEAENCLHVRDLAPCNGTIPASRPIGSILIANRGEIAVRIIKTLREMGVKSVAVYSRSDAAAEHVRIADAAWPLTGETVSETYLSASQILDTAKKAGADAVIPGYGFLAENADFAAQVEEAGLIWIGPIPEQMRDMGLKHRAREIAQAAGVPTVPGSTLLSNSVQAVAEAHKIGFPVMVKAPPAAEASDCVYRMTPSRSQRTLRASRDWRLQTLAMPAFSWSTLSNGPGILKCKSWATGRGSSLLSAKETALSRGVTKRSWRSAQLPLCPVRYDRGCGRLHWTWPQRSSIAMLARSSSSTTLTRAVSSFSR